MLHSTHKNRLRFALSRLFTVAVYCCLSAVTYAGTTDSCDLVARVFDNDICVADISVKESTIVAWKSINTSDEEISARIKQYRRRTLENRLWQLAADGMFGAMALNATDEEVSDFLRYKQIALGAAKEDARQHVEYLTKLLKENDFDDPEREKIQKSIDSHDKYQKSGDETEHQQMSKEHNKIRQAYKRAIARVVIRKQKLDRVLYKKYGGRIVFQQVGVEPVDAYREFLQELVEKRHVVILSDSYKNLIEERLTLISQSKQFLHSEEAKLALSGEPIWSTPVQENGKLDSRTRSLEEEYRHIPTRREKLRRLCGKWYYKANNSDASMEHCLQAAKLGSADALHKMGENYFFGKYTTQNFLKSREYYFKAMLLGYPMAMVRLGQLHERGQGGERNYATALQYYRLAADLDFPVGMHALATAYFDGYIVPQDINKAITLYEDASKLGDPNSKAVLIKHYARDISTKAELIRGYAWVNVGIVSKFNAELKQSMYERLTEEELIAATTLATVLNKQVGKARNNSMGKWNGRNF